MSLVLNEENYYSKQANLAYCSASQYKDFIGFPFKAGCEERALATINETWKPDITKALLIGSIVDDLWSGADAATLVEKYPDCVSTRGKTAGELKAEYKIAFTLFQRTLKDKNFQKLMSGEKQRIFTGTIADLPFKCKLDSFVSGVCITDLKTTQDASMDKRYFVKDSGQWLPFYFYMGYETQLAIYREIVRQNTGDTLRCYIAAIDKKDHPLPATIEIEPAILDKALEEVKRNCDRIIRLKKGEIKPIRCESGDCDYCRDTYECTIVSTSEFETHDISKNDI